MTKINRTVESSTTMRSIARHVAREDGGKRVELRGADDNLCSLNDLKAVPVDLLHSDIDLHNLDFINAVNSQRISPPSTVTTTKTASDQSSNKGTSRGANGHLKQPFTPESLREVIGPLSS